MSLAKPVSSPDRRVEDLLARMTLHDKVSLLSGRDTWRTVPLPHYGIPSLTMTDGPHGVRACDPSPGRPVGKTTYFPTGVSMAASWNPSIVEEVGKALARETLAMECDILLAPCVNIVRGPLAGRNFESYAEDPYLAGRIGVAYVKGVHAGGAGTSLKHFACNNQESDRMRGNSVVDERTLREIYLPAFETIVKEADPWTVMCAYNRVNGDYASQNRHLLTTVLRQEWGYKGVVISDWGANHTIFESMHAGLDIEMPGPAKYYGRLLEEAVNHWQIEESAIDEAVRRIVRLLYRSGRMTNPKRPAGRVNTEEHQKLSRRLAEESITLLKNNDNLLPIDARKVSSIAVIGPNSLQTPIGGGSSWVDAPFRTGPLGVLKDQLGKRVKIKYAAGCENWADVPQVQSSLLRPGRGKGNGLWAEYFANATLSGKPVVGRVEASVAFWHMATVPVEGVTPDMYSVRWTGTLTAPSSGLHTIQLSCTGAAKIWIDGKVVARRAMPSLLKHENIWTRAAGVVELEKGRTYRVKIEYVKIPNEPASHVRFSLGRISKTDFSDEIKAAAALAATCDVALVFAGYPDGHETEGRDRPDMEITGPQNRLIERVVAANPNTVVVINAGAPLTMPWIDAVKAVVLAYYPGMDGGNAVVNVLLGRVNPSGKLPVTWPKKLEDAPTATNSLGSREVRYGEGIFVGYRYYEKKQIPPLFPFGHGLSYTSFKYSGLTVPRRVTNLENVPVSLEVTNTGKRAGAEVVQLYVGDRACSLERPAKELKRFAKVFLRPGQTKKVRFSLDRRAFAFYDPYGKTWMAEHGDFEISAGSSSSDIRQNVSMTYIE